MIGFDVALLLLLGVMSMFLASVEAAFYLVKGRRIAQATDPRAVLVNRYLEDPPALLMPVHMGAFTAHAGMTVVITALLLDHLKEWAMLVAFLAMVAYLLVFRLTLPYALVRSDPVGSLLLLISPFHVYAQALRPLLGILRPRTEPEEEPNEASPEVRPAPVHDADQERLLDAVARFGETPVRQVMTPRPDLVAVPAQGTVEEVRKVVRETRYSRVLVYGDNLDDIKGFVTVRDLLEYEGDLSDPVRPLRSALLVPETKKISELLKEMQNQHTSLAVVIDEYGGTAGLVSVEDIVEELVGEIKDEYDVEAEPITVDRDGSVVVTGRTAVGRLAQALEIEFSEEVGTVGGLVGALFGRIPRVGEKLEHRGFTIEVLDAERKRVNRVRFRRNPE